MRMINVLLEKVKKVLGKDDDNVADTAEMMLLIVESIVEQVYLFSLVLAQPLFHFNCIRYALSASEDNKMALDQETTASVNVSVQDAISQMTLFLDKLASPLVRNNTKISQTIARIIPFLTYGNERYASSI